MEDNLKNLPEKMNSTILKDLDFDKNRMFKVLKTVKEDPKDEKGSLITRTWKFTLSTALFASLLMCLTWFAIEQLKPEPTSETQLADEKIVTKPANKNTPYVPEEKNEYFGEMTKEEILTKMINTVDYFETAKGSFEEVTNNDKTIIEYELDMKDKIGGYSKTTHFPSGKEVPQLAIDYYDDKKVWSIFESDKTYRESNYLKTATCCTLTIENAFTVDSEGVNFTSYRDRPPIGRAQNSLFPYEIASNYTRDLNSWDIEKQNEKVAGHNTLVIKGKLDAYASEKHRSSAFRFWVDKDTGILIQYETYNNNNEVVNYLRTKELMINVPVDPSKLKPNLKRYRDQFEAEEKLPSITSGIDESYVPEEIREEWKLARNKNNETSVMQFKGKWYIIPEKGYVVDRIETKGAEGTVYLSKASDKKSQYVIPVMAVGYGVETLNISK
ncbi:hypothetical protein AWM68_02255 [Fictibacillus phosphorivorans]|uniref:MucB/RseB N-terminal domain-containing protein n=1 Tax=Fictibacillus phosphorivorans TaxID=1221500 RepID=A0A163SHL3_9BACL|nr:sigma-E factor regulatory protein RseB domain-containing protein [Fictibacillus phosphorivorans]KZE69109.1 hypothetical protein AWM68_02255 [Fictibacillus phosphorivorans]